MWMQHLCTRSKGRLGNQWDKSRQRRDCEQYNGLPFHRRRRSIRNYQLYKGQRIRSRNKRDSNRSPENSFFSRLFIQGTDNLLRKLNYSYGIIDAIAFTARNEGIAEESNAAEANGSVISADIRPWFTISVNSARIRVAQIA